MRKKLISIIAPGYNESSGLELFYTQMTRTLKDPVFARYDVEVIMVDNASTDDSAQYLERIAASDGRFRVIFNARNVGVFASAFNALSFARGAAVFLLVPTDLQDPLELMPKMIEKWEEGYLLVAGRRQEREEGALMRGLRTRFYELMAQIAEQPMEPGVGDYQLADRRVVDELLSVPDAMPFPRGLLAELGYKPYIMDYQWKQRKWGKSSFTMMRLLRTAYDMIFSFSRLPLRLILIMGFVIASLSIIFIIIQIIAIIVEGRIAGRGISTIIIALFFFAGINAVFLGIIGEYVGRIYQQTRFGRRVAVQRMLNFDPVDDE